MRDIYAFYPLLIKYVDLQRNHWLRNNIVEAEDLYKHVAEIFNLWSKSQVRKSKNPVRLSLKFNFILINF